MRQATLARGRLAEHPVWSRALANPDLAGRVILPVIVGSAIEDREKVEGAPWLERLSLTEVVREARSAASAGLAGLLLFGISDRKDEHAMLASEPDHVVPRAIREALGQRRSDTPIAAMVKLESSLYVTHRSAVNAIPIAERAVPLVPADDAAAAVARARRDIADGADAIIVKPGAPGLDIVARLAAFADRPLISYFTADEHAPFVATTEGPLDPAAAEREHLAAARRAGASLVISSGASSVVES